MDGRWFQYKDNIVNLGQIQGFSVERVRMSGDQAVRYTGDVKPTKKKPWLLFAGHQCLDAFETKPQALDVAKRIVKGNFDLKG